MALQTRAATELKSFYICFNRKEKKGPLEMRYIGKAFKWRTIILKRRKLLFNSKFGFILFERKAPLGFVSV